MSGEYDEKTELCAADEESLRRDMDALRQAATEARSVQNRADVISLVERVAKAESELARVTAERDAANALVTEWIGYHDKVTTENARLHSALEAERRRVSNAPACWILIDDKLPTEEQGKEALAALEAVKGHRVALVKLGDGE